MATSMRKKVNFSLIWSNNIEVQVILYLSTIVYKGLLDVLFFITAANKDYNVLLGATKRSPLEKVPSCSMVTANSQSCLCRYEICVGW